MSIRQTVSSGAPMEATFGYCRAVRVGRRIWVSGTTAFDEHGKVVGAGDPLVQTERVMTIIESALVELGAALTDVVRTRIFTTDISCWAQIARVHGQRMGRVRPACTLVEVSALIDPDLLVEIEAEAVVSQADRPGDDPGGGDA